jgi:hypothetical protein
MKVKTSCIRIFNIKNRKGYAAICKDHLTEGKTLYQVYERMLKALKRSKIEVVGKVVDIKRLVKAVA